jgi:hypothetical protein
MIWRIRRIGRTDKAVGRAGERGIDKVDFVEVVARVVTRVDNVVDKADGWRDGWQEVSWQGGGPSG